MEKVRSSLGVIQNLGWLDRVVRFVIGAVMVGVPMYVLASETTPAWISQTATPSWTYYLFLIAVYPVATAILGWDPVYSRFKVKTCDTSERNQCGTFPYEVDAAMGRHPIPEGDVEHSLEHSHHDKSRQVGT